MSVEEVMEKHGFSLSASCAGQAAFTKFIEHKGRRAYLTVTGANGEGFPTSMDEPVRVVIYDWRSGDELGPHEDFSSLGSYLDSLKE